MIPKNAKVFPLKHNLKEPATVHAHLNAVPYDPEKIEITDNYGISLDDQWLVVDFDCPADHPDRVILEESLKPTWTQTTLKVDGKHYLYAVPDGFKGKNAKVTGRDGIHIADIKVKGYIVGPGSEVDRKAYKALSRIDPSPASESLLNLVLVPSKALRNDSEGQEQLSGVPKGQHDNFLQSAGGWLRDKWGLDADALYRIEREGLLAALKDPDPSDPYTEEDSLKRAKRLSKHDTHVDPTYSIKKVSVLTNGGNFDLPVLDWYIPGFILQGGYLMTGYAPGGTGKSSFGHFLAARVTQLGDNFLVINHEDHPDYWRDCAIVSGAVPEKIYSHNSALSVRLPKAKDDLINLIEEYKIKFIWFDSLKDHMPRGGHGDAQDQARDGLSPLADIATRTGCAIFGVFHANKKGLPGGSTSFSDVARIMIEFKREKGKNLTLRVEKTNIKEPGFALEMFGGEKVLVDPKNPNSFLLERNLETGKIEKRTAWITESYTKDKDLLRKLEEEQEKGQRVEKMLEMKKEGKTDKEIGDSFNISRGRVSQILRGQSSEIKIEDLS